ncbi:MAG: hypothetical protein JW940_20870 [Polyangiaceae bacterium]|nr:hypothetical protein [Polyangiaceae bacterium]
MGSAGTVFAAELTGCGVPSTGGTGTGNADRGGAAPADSLPGPEAGGAAAEIGAVACSAGRVTLSGAGSLGRAPVDGSAPAAADATQGTEQANPRTNALAENEGQGTVLMREAGRTFDEVRRSDHRARTPSERQGFA